jgi:hypothetical protein
VPQGTTRRSAVDGAGPARHFNHVPRGGQPLTIQEWTVLATADLLMVGGLAFTVYAAASLRHCFRIGGGSAGFGHDGGRTVWSDIRVYSWGSSSSSRGWCCRCSLPSSGLDLRSLLPVPSRTREPRGAGARGDVSRNTRPIAAAPPALMPRPPSLDVGASRGRAAPSAARRSND